MTQQEKGSSQNIKIIVGVFALLAIAAGLYLYFNGLNANQEVTNPTVIDSNETNVVTTPSQVTTIPTLENTPSSPITDSENSDVTRENIGGINPPIPLAKVPNTNPFSPLYIESVSDSNINTGSSISGSSTITFNDDYNSSSFSEPSVPVITPTITSRTENLSGTGSSWDFDSSETITLDRPATTNAEDSTSNDQFEYQTANNADNNSASWDFGSSSNSGDTSTGGLDNSSESSGIIVGLAPQQVPQSFGSQATNSTTTPTTKGTTNSPALVKQYGAISVAAPDDGTQLSRVLNSQDYRFTGSVIGPTDTAIFKSAQGFNVLEEGQVLPGTNIVVHKIDSQRVVLALGNETVTLNLESLENF